ncbi:MAG: nitroreductase family protein [Clostridia bacterium]|nr:nitroreductase family protein [Clostridia bacterium]
MNFYDVINARHTVREFENIKIEAEKLERIINAGIKAPSNNHLRQWEFVLLENDEDKKNALRYVMEGMSMQKVPGAEGSKEYSMYSYAIPRQYAMLIEAGAVVMPFFKAPPAWYTDAPGVNKLNGFASIWCVIENILLAATAEGLACAIRIPVGDESEKAAKAVNAPDGYVFPCYIGIGYEKGGIRHEQYRPDAKEKIHKGKW